MSTVQNGHQSLVLFTPGAAPDIQTQIANGSMQVRSNSGNASACTQYRLAPASVSLSMSSAMGRRRYTGNMEPVVTGLVSTPSSTNLRTNPPRYANPSISIFNTGNTFSNFSHSTSNSEATGFAQVPGVTYTIDAHGGLVGTRTTAGDLDLDVHASQLNSHVLDLQQAIAGFVLEFDYLGTGSRGTYI